MEEKKMYLVALFVVLGGNTGSFINYVNPNVRADPFSGLDAAIMKADILNEMDNLFDEEHARHIDNEIKINNLLYRMVQCERVK